MKLNKIKLVIAMFALTATSCSLDRFPLDEVSDVTYWKTESDLATYNNGLYAYPGATTGIMIGHGYKFDGNGQVDSYFMLDLYSDNVASQYANFAIVRSGLGTVPATPNQQDFGYEGWNFLYEINYGLANYDRADVSQEIKDRYIGEAKLLRGWFYAVKVQRFGDVQWIDEPLNIDSEELYGERDSRDFVMGKVLEDLNAAVDGLPEEWGDAGSPGRINKYLALAIKARVCLFEGTFRKYHGLDNYTMWLEEARDAAKQVILSEKYDLDVDYNNLTSSEDLSDSKQVIYWRRYNYGIEVQRHHAMGYFQQNSGGATMSMVDSYLCTDGQPISNSSLYQGDNVIEKSFEHRDPRMRMTLLHPDDAEKLNYYITYNPEAAMPRLPGMNGTTVNTGYHVIKMYKSTNTSTEGHRTGVEAGVIAQYAEVLLNYAEAVAELETINQNDLDITVNKLRDRVGMPHLILGSEPVDPQAAEDGVSALIYEIRRERRVELFAEGFRYDDLMRWKQGKKLAEKMYGMQWNEDQMARYNGDEPFESIRTVVDDKGITRLDPLAGTDYANPVFNEDKDYLWPIPLSVISKNTNIKQNPGWK